MHDAIFLYFRTACLCVVIAAAGGFGVGIALAASSAIVQSTIKISVCGNNVVEGGEQCDGSNLNGASCTTLGWAGGTLSCTPACEFNQSACTPGPPVSSGGGGGGGNATGGGIVSVPSTSAVFSGKAYPGSTVTLLKDAQIVATTIAGSDATFSINLSGLSGGNYIFSVYSEDKKGIRSSLLTFPVSVTSGTTANITGIFIAPTIATDKSEVRRGDNIAIFGQTAPAAEVTVSINSEEEFFVKKIADATGAYLLNFDTSVLDMGQHLAKSKSALSGEITGFGSIVGFTVGTKNVAAQLSTAFKKGDLNKDGKVNLVDFSIAAFWYKRALSQTFKPVEIEALNGDGKIDLVDFSIMAFYWTG
jgi:hypothetical protein